MVVGSVEEAIAQSVPGRLLRRINRLMVASVEKRLSGSDISFSQWITLKLAAETSGRQVGEFARAIAITNGAMTRLLDGLQDRGLVYRSRSGSDRRVIDIVVSQKGHDTLGLLSPIVADAWSDILTDFKFAEVAQLIELLGKLLMGFERECDTARTVLAEAAE